MYACTGASPSDFATCGLPPERSFTGLAFVPGLDFAPAFGEDLDFVADLCDLLAGDLPFAFGFTLFGMFKLDP